MTAFAEGLRGELALHNVDVAVMSPWPTRSTPMVKFEGMKMAKRPKVWMTADKVAK